MRPVDRGKWPVGDNGLPIAFAEYGEAKPHLIRALGLFCSYCEMPILNQPATEHVEPKIRHVAHERTWCNLLLACCYCNATKGAQDPGRTDLLWPDADNTARAFSYSEAGVRPKEGLPAELLERARRTWRLTGLDKRPGGEREPSAADPRFRRRQEVWDQASSARDTLQEHRTPKVIRIIVELARSSGFWSVWMAIFEDDREMRDRLIRAFEGTSVECFDAQTRPVPRAGGAL